MPLYSHATMDSVEILYHPGTRLIFVAAIPFSPLSFLALAIYDFWLLLAFIVFWLLIIAFPLGVWLVLFIFLNSTSTVNCWLTLCVVYSAFARENVGPFIQSFPPLLGRALTPGSSLLQPGLWVSDPFWAYFKTSCGSNRLCENIENNNPVLTVDHTLFQMIYS